MRRTELKNVSRVTPYPWAKPGIRDASRLEFAIAIAPVLLLISAAMIWAISLPYVRLSTMNDLGLISVLPPGYFFSLVLLTMSFCLSLRSPLTRNWVLLADVGLLVLILYGTPALVEQTPHFAVTWRHLGLVDFVVQNGVVRPKYSAYFDWPGFFTLGALVTRVTGLSSLVNFVAWTSMFLNLLYLLPLVVIYRSSARNSRLTWLALWIFYLANWVGQDYFSPQGFAYFLYLAVLAILLAWFRGRSFGSFRLDSVWIRFREKSPRLARLIVGQRQEAASSEASPRQRLWLMAAAIAMFAAMVPSHQLTPFGALLAVGLLTVFNQTRTRTLPILFAVIIIAWLVFPATPYLTGHLASKVSTVGTVDQNVQHGVAGRVHGSAGHMLVVRLRLVMTAAVALMAIVGFCRWLIAGHRDLSIAFIAIAPAPLLLAQYGGEMFLRVYFYSLPGLAFFAAASFYPNLGPLHTVTTANQSDGHATYDKKSLTAFIPFRPGADFLPSWRTIVSIGLVSIVLVEGFLITRYGNERMDYFTPEEVAAARFLYSVAPPGSLFEAPGISVPWQFEGFTTYKTEWVSAKVVKDADIATLEADMSTNGHGSYLLVTRSAAATLELYDGLDPGVLSRFEKALVDSGHFVIIYQNADARVYLYVHLPAGRGPR